MPCQPAHVASQALSQQGNAQHGGRRTQGKGSNGNGRVKLGLGLYHLENGGGQDRAGTRGPDHADEQADQQTPGDASAIAARDEPFGVVCQAPGQATQVFTQGRQQHGNPHQRQ